ncbi:hypothetical protein [Legionella pneumophila]|uniref:hypothetical protein n=1 Tax=Legionella pneumophila TaxID=446 RepID=UPI00399CB8E0
MTMKHLIILIIRIFIGFSAFFILNTASAGIPLWTFTPQSATTIQVPVNGSGIIQYTIKNQSSRSHRLVIIPLPGLSQTAPCQLAPKGAIGDTCILMLVATGSALPEAGISGGPSLCQANSNGSPNLNLCYQPGAGDSLNLSVGPAITNISVTPVTLLFAANSSGTITITNTVGSPVAANNIVATIPSGSNITVQSSTCPSSLAIGASCTITLTSAAQEGPTTITIAGSNTNTATTQITVGPPLAIINVTPPSLLFAENSTGSITVTNIVGSPVAANNVVATIPGGSNISVQSSTCPSSLAIGTDCTITFASGVQEGPTSIPVAGSNTNTAITLVTVTSQPTISISAPIQANRVIEVGGITPLILTITNDISSLVNANNISISDQTNCPAVTFDDSNCTSIAPGISCNLELNSPTPYIPCTITISGSNTANSPTTPIAFQFLNGLVFESNGVTGKVVSLLAAEFNNIEWTLGDADIAGTSNPNNGITNTDNIIADPTCSNNPLNCAASRCRSLGPVWYLPAINELQAVAGILCPGGTCNFGGFASDAYWSSTQSGINDAEGNSFPIVNTVFHPKNDQDRVRCTQSFP